MSAADEDDYLSDKFLTEAGSTSSAPKTYAQIRKQAKRNAQLKNEQNRLKTRKQREVEAREEGLSKSLFERAKEDEEAGISTGSKALSMMMKMGFKPGQSLGQSEETIELPEPSRVGPLDIDGCKTPPLRDGHSIPRHKIEPLPLNEWAGVLLFHPHRIAY
jgi:G-patch domain